MEDEKIIELYWKRDEEALTQTNLKYGSYCYYIAYNILKDEEDCKECVNDTWFKAWITIPPKRPSLFRAFLGKITRNLSLDRYRKSHSYKRGGGNLALVYEELEECIGKNGADERIDAIIITDAITSFLAQLSHDSRVIFVRRYWYADSIEQIAKRYAVSESKVKSALMRSRKKLKDYLEKEGIMV